MKITNNTDVPLTLAVWAVHDDYDHIAGNNYISVTTLMKPVKQIVLQRRLPVEMRTQIDVQDLIASSWGSALHGSIENAWLNYGKNLKKLGYPDSVIERIKINPTDEEVGENTIAIYMEQRGFIELSGWKVGGKFDFVAEGIVQDNKSTSAYSWVFGGKDGDYSLQGSLYRLIHPDKITEDFIRINFLFTDWKKSDARQNPRYPQSRLASKDIPLMTIDETREWAITKLALIDSYMDAPEQDIPRCTDEELWRSSPKYKYYKDPAKATTPGARSTKNFDTLSEANAYWKVDMGGVGIVKTIPGEVKRCLYCAVAPICKQRLEYELDD